VTHALQSPPANLDAERSVLGAALLGSPLADLSPEDFFKPVNSQTSAHGQILAAMQHLKSQGNPIDLVLLVEELQRRGQLEQCGGAPYLASLADGMPKVSNIEHYARIVKEKATLRRIAAKAELAREMALSSNGNAAETLGEIAALCAAPVGTEPVWRGMFHSYDELENAPPLQFGIRNFAQDHALNLFGGPPGSSKTWLLLCMIGAEISGAPLFGHFPVEEKAVRCLLLIPECAVGPLVHRLRKLNLLRYTAPDDERLLVRTLSKGPAPRLSDPRILCAAKGSHVFLDTAARFREEGIDENSAGDNQQLASDCFGLLAAGARSVNSSHHSPKAFARDNAMRLETVLRGSGDIGAMAAVVWGLKQLDASNNVIHLECVKARDFEPPQPFQLIGRPSIDERGDLQMHKLPGECGTLEDEQPERDKGGAPTQAREAKAANLELLRGWLCESPSLTSQAVSQRFRSIGIKLGDSAIRKYRKELGV
jgi:hypothetical protein